MQTKRNCNSWSIIDFCSSSCRRINASEWHQPLSFAQSNMEKLSEWCTNPLHFNLVDEADWKCSDAQMRNRRNHKKFEFSRAVRRIFRFFCRTSNFARKGYSSLPALFFCQQTQGRNGFSAACFSVPGFPFMFFLYTVFHHIKVASEQNKAC